MSVSIRDFHLREKVWVRATLGQTTVHGLLTTTHRSDMGEAFILDVPGTKTRHGYDGIWLWLDEDWTIDVIQDPIILPTEPGTVIAIGDWWLVLLRPYHDDAPAGWELLPAPKETNEKMRRQGITPQCVYGAEWVLAEAQQHGSIRIIANPNDDADKDPR